MLPPKNPHQHTHSPSPPSSILISPCASDAELKTIPANTLTPPLSPPFPPQTFSEIDVVIAHYNEDLTWLGPFPPSCTIYSKGNPPSSALPANTSSQVECTPSSSPPTTHANSITPSTSLPTYGSVKLLPNIGRETHTYLTHIVTHYSSLPPHLLFLQGDIHSVNQGSPAHTDFNLAEIISITTHLCPYNVFPIGSVHPFSDWDVLQYKPAWMERRGNTLERSKLSPREFWHFIFSDTDRPSDMPNREPPKEVRFVQGACFGVTREAILRRPKAFYQWILEYFVELMESNPEEGHYMERFWYAIFSDEALGGGEEGRQ